MEIENLETWKPESMKPGNCENGKEKQKICKLAPDTLDPGPEPGKTKQHGL